MYAIAIIALLGTFFTNATTVRASDCRHQKTYLRKNKQSEQQMCPVCQLFFEKKSLELLHWTTLADHENPDGHFICASCLDDLMRANEKQQINCPWCRSTDLSHAMLIKHNAQCFTPQSDTSGSNDDVNDGYQAMEELMGFLNR